MSKDIHNCATLIANDVICAYFDGGKKPTIKELRENWKSANYAELTDVELATIIANVNKYYNL